MKLLITILFLIIQLASYSQPEIQTGPLLSLRSAHQKVGAGYNVGKWFPSVWFAINKHEKIYGAELYRSIIEKPNTVDVLAGMSVFKGPPGYPNGWLRIESRFHITDSDWGALNVGAGYGIMSLEIKYIHKFILKRNEISINNLESRDWQN